MVFLRSYEAKESHKWMAEVAHAVARHIQLSSGVLLGGGGGEQLLRRLVSQKEGVICAVLVAVTQRWLKRGWGVGK
jgi:type IV secretory pathway TrbD component